MGRHAERAHTSREVLRTLRQRIHLNRHTRSLNLFIDLHITATAIEEGLEGVDIAVLLNDRTIISDAGNFQLTRHLGEHHILLPSDGAILAPIITFYLETLLLRQRHFTGIETLQVGHLTAQLGQADECIDLIS